MEQIELQLSEFTLRSRSMAVGHMAAGLGRGLELGETIVVRDLAADGAYAAVVADIDFELHDTVYRIELGARLAPEEASDWLTAPAADSEQLSTRDVMTLLAQLRRSRRRLRALVDEAAR